MNGREIVPMAEVVWVEKMKVAIFKTATCVPRDTKNVVAAKKLSPFAVMLFELHHPRCICTT